MHVLAAAQPAAHATPPAGRAQRTLVLAALRGALLDLLATGDVDRTGAALRVLVDSVAGQCQAHPHEP